MIKQTLSYLSAEWPDWIFRLDQQTIQNIVFHAINVAVLFLLMFFILYKPVLKFMGKRTNRIQEQIDTAQNEMESAVAIKTEYTQKIKEIERERDEIINTARKQASDASKATLAEAKQEADAMLARAKANIDLEWERNRAQMRLEIINVSADMTEKYLKQAVDKAALDRMFDETMAELGEMAWRN